MGKERTVNTRPIARTALLAFTSALSFGGLGCEQPLPRCDVAQSLETGGNFAARYTLKEGSATGTGDCDQLVGETLYFGSFYKRNGDDTPNYRKVSVGIQPESTLGPLENAQGAMVTPNPADKPYAYGGFEDSEPNNDGFCEVRELSPARVRLPDAPAWEMPNPEDEMAPPIMNAEQPAIDLKYEFSNVQVYMTVGSPGRQLTAELTYSRRVPAEDIDCTAKYTISALFPATYCGLDEMGAPVGTKKENDQACQDNPIFADDAVECDQDLHLCVLTKAVPSFR